MTFSNSSNILLQQASAQELSECVDLLLRIGAPPDGLCNDYLAHARTKLQEDLKHLQGREAKGLATVAQSSSVPRRVCNEKVNLINN